MIKVGQTTTNETITLPYELTNDGDTSISLQELKGNTTQNGTPTPTSPQQVNVVKGKNLFNINASNTNLGIQYLFNGSELSLNGTTSQSGNIYNVNTNIIILESGTYTFSTTKSGTFTANSKDVAIYLKNKTSNSTITTLSQSNSYTLTNTFTLNETTELYIQIYTNGAGFVFNNFKINLQLEQGSATPYLPYNTIQAKVVGKNIADISQIQIGKAWNSDSYTNRASILYIPIEKGKSYYLSSTYTSSAITSIRAVFNHGISDKANCYVVTSFPYTNNTWEYASIEVLANTTITSEMLNGVTIQFEQSSSPTTYEAYKSNNYPITLGDIELCKIGTYQDRIYKNNGKWYLYKATGKAILVGGTNENYTMEGNYGGGVYRFTLESPSDSVKYTDNARHGNLYSNYFVVHSNIADNVLGAFFQYNHLWYFYKDNSSVADFKTWLGSHNTIVYYALATPTTTEITDETLLEQLDAIGELYRGTNNIMITDTIAPVENIIIEKSNAEFDLVPYIKREPKIDYIDRKGDTGYTADGHYFENIIARKRAVEFELIPMSQDNYLSVISHFIDKTEIPVYIDDLFTGETNLINTWRKEKIPTKQITENGTIRGTTIKLEEI